MPLSYVTALSQGDTHVMAAGSEGTIRVGDVLLEVDGLPTRNLDPQGVLPLDLVLLRMTRRATSTRTVCCPRDPSSLPYFSRCLFASLLLWLFSWLAGRRRYGAT